MTKYFNTLTMLKLHPLHFVVMNSYLIVMIVICPAWQLPNISSLHCALIV